MTDWTSTTTTDFPRNNGKMCPKCGMNKGNWFGPHYVSGTQGNPYRTDEPEKLVYDCSVCHYQYSTPTKEAK